MIRVLVTNDDGIEAGGIQALAAALGKLPDTEVYVVAPTEQQSAKSQSVTFLRSIKSVKSEMQGAKEVYAIDGTPTDCIKWGLGMMEKRGIWPDYVFSGINLGMNTGLAAYYSGTIAAAREGALSGVKSIALSVGSHEAREFEYILGMIPMLMDMAGRISSDVLLSVNAPERPADKIKGYMIVEAAPFGYGENYVFADIGGDHYQMSSTPGRQGDSMRYDFDAVRDDYVAISPIPTSMTDRVSLARLRNACSSDRYLAVIVDAQDGVLAGLPKRDRLERRLGTLAYCMDRMDLPVLQTLSYGKGELIEALREHASRSESVERMQTDVWLAEDMNRYTALTDAVRVLIAGAETHEALLQAARGFLERGYEVTVLEDCCESKDPADHNRAIEELREAGCSISGYRYEMMKIAREKDTFVRAAVERILN